jgi:hypothetical protein
MKSLTFSQLLNSYFGMSHLDKIKYFLICRYWDKVSDRLKKEHDDILLRSRNYFCNLLNEEFNKSLFKNIVKKDSWNYTSVIDVPVKYEDE